jgi:hypothetical protein
MWRKVVTPRAAEQPVAQAFPQPAPQLAQRAVQQPTQQPTQQREALTAQPTNPIAEQEALRHLLLPRPRRTLSQLGRLSFWARTSRGSTTRAACFFQHVSATTWLRAS